MAWKFNPFTGTFDLEGSGSGGTSFLLYDLITALQTVNIAVNTQYPIFVCLTILGNLNIQGTLVLRD